MKPGPKPSLAVRPSSPSVKLSPNARNFVTLSRSGVSVTEKEHCACRDFASTAVHATPVVPTVKGAPEPGVHVTFTGAAPPVTTGAGYVTG
jgi:hypothetical protein